MFPGAHSFGRKAPLNVCTTRKSSKWCVKDFHPKEQHDVKKPETVCSCDRVTGPKYHNMFVPASPTWTSLTDSLVSPPWSAVPGLMLKLAGYPARGPFLLFQIISLHVLLFSFHTTCRTVTQNDANQGILTELPHIPPRLKFNVDMDANCTLTSMQSANSHEAVKWNPKNTNHVFVDFTAQFPLWG